jgi:hypothetical protein
MEAAEILAGLLAHLQMRVREFALSLGYERAENFYNVQKGKSPFQYDALKAIVKTYPEINPDWLLDNSAQMLRTQRKQPEIMPATEPAFMLTIQLLEKEIKEKEKRIKELESR